MIERHRPKKIPTANIFRKIETLEREIMVRGFPNLLSLYTVNEYPKSGGTWIGQMLGSALNIPFPRNGFPVMRSSIMHGHYLSPRGMRNVVVVWRDGRDVIVSWYFHCLFKNDRNNAALVDIVRKDLPFDDYENVRENLPAFIKYAFTKQRHPRYSWSDFVHQWYGRAGVTFIRYEDMCKDTPGELKKLVLSLTGSELDHEKAVEISREYSFERQSGREIGEEIKGSFMRKGLVGDWQNQFTRESKDLFDFYGGRELILLGYEQDRSWMKSIGENLEESIQSIAKTNPEKNMDYFEKKPCPVCGSEKSESVFPIDKTYASYHSRIDLSDIPVCVVRCNTCSHEFIQPVPQSPFLEAFYSSYLNKAKDGFYRDRNKENISEAFRLRYGKWLDRIKSLQEGRTLMDVGAGLGMFLRLAMEKGFTIAGVEPNPESASLLKERYGITVHNCMLEELETSDRYDAITMWDLFEHLPEPRTAIRKIYNILNPAGLVVLEIPVRDSFVHWLVKKVYQISYGRIKRPLFLVYGIHHLQYFSQSSIRTFLMDNGFEVVELHQGETDIRQKLKKPQEGVGSRFKAVVFNTALRIIFFTARLISRQNKVVVFARKVGV